jgi:hypothetical protein
MMRSAARWSAARIGQAVRGLSQALSASAILWLGFAVFLLYAFPGYMSNDSVTQLLEARSRQFTNPHPPIMAAEWSILDAIVSGPILMLLLQGALFLHGCAGVLRRAMSPRVAAAVASAVLVFPPVITTMAVIWKDAQMAAYLVAGTALLLGERRRTRLIGLVLVTAGCAFRYNAFGAAVPLVFALFEWRPGLRWFQRYAISLAAAVAMVVVAFGTNRALTVEAQPLSPTYVDIAGVLAYTHDRSDDELREVLRDTPLHSTTNIQARARAVLSPRTAWLVDHGDGRVFDHAKTDVQRQALTRAWKTLVLGDLPAYLAFRRDVFCELIGVTPNDPWGSIYNWFLEMPEQMSYTEHNATWSQAQGRLSHVYGWFVTETPLFRPYVYIAVALILLVLCCRDSLTFALLGSGLTYELSFFPAAGTPDFRYSQWMITCTCLAVALLFAQRLRRARVRPT